MHIFANPVTYVTMNLDNFTINLQQQAHVSMDY